MYLFLCFLALGGMVVVAVKVWPARATRAGHVGLMAVGCVFGWLLTVILALLSPTLSLALFWHETVRLIFIILLPPLIILYMASYFGVPRPSRLLVVVLFAIPVFTIGLDLTNSLHHWFLASYAMQRVGPYFVRSAWAAGPWFPTYALVAGGSMLLAVGAVVVAYQRRALLYRAQARVFVLSLLPPAALLTFDILSGTPLALLGLAPLGFAATALLLTWLLDHYRLLDLVPVAREAIFAGMADVVVAVDGRGRVIDLNPAAEHVLGRSTDTVLGTHIDQLLPRSLVDLQAITRKQTGLREVLTLGNERDARHYDVRVSSFGLRAGSVDGHLLVLRDVTELQQTEARLREHASQLEAIFEAMSDGLAVYDLQGTFVRANRSLHELYGFATDWEFTLRPLADRAQRLRLFNEASQPLAAHEWPHWQVLRGEKLSGASPEDMRVRTLDGREIWVSTTGAPIRDADGKVTGTVLITRDVTARRQLEQQVTQQARELETILEATPDVIGVCDRKGRLVRVNRALRLAIASLGLETFAALSPRERAAVLDARDADGQLIPEEALPDVRALRGQVLEGDTAIDMRVGLPGGHQLDVNVAAAPLRDDAGQVLGAVSVYRDITARRQLEQQIAKRASEVEAVFAAIAEGIAIYDGQGHIIESNRAFQEMLGVSADPDYLGRAYPERVAALQAHDPQGQPVPFAQMLLTRALQGEAIPADQAPDTIITTRDGRTITLSRSAVPIRDAQEHVTGVVIVHRDVTQRRALEQQVAEQASQLEAIFAAMADGVFVLNAEGHVTRINPAAEVFFQRATGEDRALEAIDRTAAARARTLDLRDGTGQSLPVEKLPTARLLRGEVLAGATALTLQLGTDTDHPRIVSLTGGPLRDATGQRIGAVGVVRDVTELEQAQAALAQQERQYRTLVEHFPDIITRFDRSLRQLYVSPHAEMILGIPTRERIGKTYAELGVPKRLYVPWEQALTEVFTTAEPRTFDATSPYGKTGEQTNYYRIRYIPEFGADGSVESVLGIATDITELRLAEQRLAQLERQYRTLVENSPDIIARFDDQGRFLYVSPAIRQISPLPVTDYLGKTNADLGWPEAAFWPSHGTIRQVFQMHLPFAVEMSDASFRDPEAAHYYNARILPEFGVDGRVESALTVMTDITALKRTEQALRAATGVAEAARQEEAQRRREAERRKEIAESLREVLAILNSKRSLQEVLGHVVRQVEHLLGSEAAAIYGVERGGVAQDRMAAPTALRVETLTLQAAYGLQLTGQRRQTQQTHLRLPFASAAALQALETRQPVVVMDINAPRMEDSAADDGTTTGASTPIERGALPAPYQALLVVPIQVYDEIYGCLLLFSTTPRRFAAEEIALALAYADQAGLAIANARLQAHIQQEAAVAERNRLARELHDTVTQDIFSASLMAESIPRNWQTNRTVAEASLQQLHGLTRSALAGLRVLLLELRPADLERMPLAQLLRQLGSALSSRAGAFIAVHLDDGDDGDDGATEALPIEVKVALYRITQEALTNAAKYAAARSITVHLRTMRAGGIVLEIKDDGRGFDLEAIPAGHLGLALLRERAQAVGATVHLQSRPGQGTAVRVEWRPSRTRKTSRDSGTHALGPREGGRT
jgi:PAS domain S-box-containing protein